MKKTYLISILAILALLASCKKDTTIGANILPSDDLSNAKFTDTFTLYSKTIADTFLRTDKLALNYLGVINDPIFGFQKASIVMELDKPSTVYDDTLGPFTVDSVVLLLKYNTIYGDTTVPQDFTVSTITTPINENSIYYSNNSSFPTSSTIGTLSNYYFTPTINKVIMSATDTLGTASVVRVPINTSIGNTILNLGQNTLRDSMSFKNAFPGIRIDNTTNNGKCMAEINLASSNSAMAIYYKNKYGITKEMRLFSSLTRNVSGTLTYKQNNINLFSNILNSTVTNVINSGLVSDSINYFLGQGGTLIKLSLPTITNLSNVAINKVSIKVTQIFPNSTSSLSTPLYIFLLKKDTNGQLDVIPTYNETISPSYVIGTGSIPEGVGVMDSIYNDAIGNKMVRYSIKLTKYTQNIIRNIENNSDLYLAYYRSTGIDATVNNLYTYGFSYVPYRFIFAGANYSDLKYRMKLEIIYSTIE